MEGESRYFLGIDLGSSYTKFVVVNKAGVMQYQSVVPTLSRNKDSFNSRYQFIRDTYAIRRCCTTGYGRDSFPGDLKKTELILLKL